MADQKIKFSQLSIDDTLVNNTSFIPYLDTTDTSQSLSGTVKRTTLSAVQQSILSVSATFLPTPPRLLTIFKEVSSITSPNNTVHVYGFSAIGPVTTANIDLLITPKGTGAITSHIPDSTTIGGAKRGARAIDFQRLRSTASNVAAGDQSVIINGTSNSIDTGGVMSSVINGCCNGIFSSSCSTILGGFTNCLLSSSRSSILGGTNNIMESSPNASIVNGALNRICSSPESLVAGSCFSCIVNMANGVIVGSNSSIINGGTSDTSGIYSSYGSTMFGGAIRSVIMGSVCSILCDSIGSSIIGSEEGNMFLSCHSQVANSFASMVYFATSSQVANSFCSDIQVSQNSTILGTVASSIRCCELAGRLNTIIGSDSSHIWGSCNSAVVAAETSCIINTIAGGNKNIIIGGCGNCVVDSCNVTLINTTGFVSTSCNFITVLGNTVLIPSLQTSTSYQYGLFYDAGTCAVFFRPTP